MRYNKMEKELRRQKIKGFWSNLCIGLEPETIQLFYKNTSTLEIKKYQREGELRQRKKMKK